MRVSTKTAAVFLISRFPFFLVCITHSFFFIFFVKLSELKGLETLILKPHED